MPERRQNQIGRVATAGIPRISLGGLRLAVLDMEQTANFMIDAVFPQRRTARPLFLTSANGEVLARCSTEPHTEQLFRAADLINADGQPLVMVSRLKSRTPLPERVATTDLFHVVARKAQAAGLSFYMLGANEEENAAAVARIRQAYPKLRILGHCHGYLRGADLRARVEEINRLAPDYLWLGLGVPAEQEFVQEFMPRLCNVGVIKTSGGLFNFLSGSRGRAPRWMQEAGLEWAWRIWLEPRRLFWRYLTTNPRALYLLLNRDGASRTARSRN
jgi:N-acetylglucosaminyldiphosphoundecaprenol N-acetyl-beta-D-mannosaminyltransferase